MIGVWRLPSGKRKISPTYFMFICLMTLLCVYNEAMAERVEHAADEADIAARASAPDARRGGDEGDGDRDPGRSPSVVTNEEPGSPTSPDILEDEAFFVGEGGGDDPPGDAASIRPEAGAGGGGSVAGSSGDAVAPPPLPPPEAAPRQLVRRKQGSAMAVHFVPGGKLTYYYTARSANLVAECGNAKHGRCVQTKTMRSAPERLKAKKPGQGKPVGYLAAWLARGIGVDSKAAHWEIQPTKAERRAARDMVKADPSADAGLLLVGETSGEEGQDSEPDLVP